MQDGVPERPLDPAAVKTAEKSLLTPRNERRMKELLEALCDPTRVKIVRALRETTLAAGDLAKVINRSRSACGITLRFSPLRRSYREVPATLPVRLRHRSGLLFLPTAVLTVGSSIVAGLFMHRIGYRRLAVVTMGVSAVGFGVIAAMSPEAGVMPAVVGISLVATAIGLSFPVLLIVAQNTAEPGMLGVATSLVQLTRSLGGTLGVTALGAYMATRMVEAIGGSAVGSGELAALLRPEMLGSLNPSTVALLRTELADTLRAMRQETAGACALTMPGAAVAVPAASARPAFFRKERRFTLTSSKEKPRSSEAFIRP